MKDFLMELFGVLLILILIIGFTIGTTVLIVNANAKATCRMIEKNGIDTHLESYWFIFKDCYVGNVPYEKWISVEELSR